MKYLFCLLIASGIFRAHAQNAESSAPTKGSSKDKPETVYSIVKESRPISWYKQQQQLWKAETEKNKSDANAWYNYYAASRALRNCAWEEGKTPEEIQKLSTQYGETCNNVAAEALKAVPNSFEANYINHWNGDIFSDDSFLIKANKINPDDQRIFDDMMLFNELRFLPSLRDEFAEKLYKANEYPAAMLNWAYNLLSEVDENAIIITCGDNDTYIPWVIQGAKNFRKDVTIINYSLMTKDKYRNALFDRLGIPPLNVKMDESTEENYEENRQKILAHLFNSGKPVYVSATAISLVHEKWGNQLFLTGLAYKYSKESFDNLTIIRRNYENRFLLDYLKETFSTSISDEISTSFNGTYLPSMIKLYTHYKETEELSRKKQLELLLLKISQQTGQQSEILEILGDAGSPTIFQMALLNVKELEKKLIKTQGNVYMGREEVSNAEYNRFLDNLALSGNTNLVKRFTYDSTQWLKKVAFVSGDPSDSYHWHPAYADYPAVNITHEAAVAYCDWLTKQYNLQRKREFTQVRFRLPTEEEWRYAATGGHPTALTPFPKDSIKVGDKYRGNIKTGPGRFFDDGGFVTLKVDSYEPNALGFYCMFGNAAEMTSDPKVVKGGSWFDPYEECTFDKDQKYVGPDPRVGFRIVMEIIEP